MRTLMVSLSAMVVVLGLTVLWSTPHTGSGIIATLGGLIAARLFAWPNDNMQAFYDAIDREIR